MKPTTIRLPEDVLEALEEEAAEHDFHNRTEYIRYLIDNRELVVSIALRQREDRIRSLADQVEELEQRVAELERERPPRPETPEGIESVEELVLDEEETEEPDAEEATEDTPEQATVEMDLPDDEEEPLDLQDPGPEDIEQRAERLEFFAPTHEIREEREAAVVAAWEALHEDGQLTREEFEERIFEDHRATFTSFDGWYDRLLLPALEQLEDVERVDENTWRYAGA